MKSRGRIYLSPPHVGEEERQMLLDAFDSNWIAPLGPDVTAFERELASTCGVDAALALSSGTAAIHLALVVLGVERGDRVFCSTLTFAASANPIAYCGAEPVFLDSDEVSWNIDPDLLEEELERSADQNQLPKAVIVVDLYGQCADYDRIIDATERYGVPVIEDAAEALGASYRGKPAGSFGAMAALSFNGNKIITTSGGGALLSALTSHDQMARMLSAQARDPAPHYQHSSIGYNYRMSNILAAIGRAQLQKLAGRVERRRSIFEQYHSALSAVDGLEFMPEADYGRANRWLTCIQVDPAKFGATREDLRLALEGLDIEARPVWKPMHLQPVFRGCRVVGGAVSEQLFERGLCLPSGSSLGHEDIDLVIDVIIGMSGSTMKREGVTVETGNRTTSGSQLPSL